MRHITSGLRPVLTNRRLAGRVVRNLVSDCASDLPVFDFMVFGDSKFADVLVKRLRVSRGTASIAQVRRPSVGVVSATKHTESIRIFQQPVGSVSLARDGQLNAWRVNGATPGREQPVLVKQLLITDDPVGIPLNKVRKTDGEVSVERLSDLGVIDIATLVEQCATTASAYLDGNVVLYGNDRITCFAYDTLRKHGVQAYWINDTALPWRVVLGRQPDRDETQYLVNDFVLGLQQCEGGWSIDCLTRRKLPVAKIVAAHFLQKETLKKQISEQGCAFVPEVGGEFVNCFRTLSVSDSFQEKVPSYLFSDAAAQCLSSHARSVSKHTEESAKRLLNEDHAISDLMRMR